jgi:dUTP pyrophosphatase
MDITFKNILVNLSNEELVIKNRERICAMNIAKHGRAGWESVDALMKSDRGSIGFGHTGKS